jgi:hypothetical protein
VNSQQKAKTINGVKLFCIEEVSNGSAGPFLASVTTDKNVIEELMAKMNVK